MDRFFSIFGKVMIFVLILVAMVFGGYYFGIQTQQNIKPETIKTAQPIVATTTPITQTVITGGLSKNIGLSFDQYSILLPNNWASKKESQTTMDEKLILSKDDNSIAIFQAATGGALCLYPGDGEFEGPSSKFSNFVSLTTKDNITLRRGGDVNGTAFTICQKALDGSYQQPTNYGHISIKLGAVENKEVLTEIDLIISSLKKI